MWVATKAKLGILGVFSVIIMSFGVLFLIFAVKELAGFHFSTGLTNLICFAVLVGMSYLVSEHPKRIHDFMVWLHDALCGLMLELFKGINLRIKSKLSVWFMERETSEHVHLLSLVLCIILPASLLYVFANFYLFRENALDSMLWGLLIFFYSNFLPDIPSICRRKKKNDETKNLPWYKNYAILLFAPLLVWALYSGIRLKWRTTENFHNFKSLTAYGAFLFLLSFFAFGDFPISIGDITEIVSLPLYGLIGYLTHLKVDKIF